MFKRRLGARLPAEASRDGTEVHAARAAASSAPAAADADRAVTAGVAAAGAGPVGVPAALDVGSVIAVVLLLALPLYPQLGKRSAEVEGVGRVRAFQRYQAAREVLVDLCMHGAAAVLALDAVAPIVVGSCGQADSRTAGRSSCGTNRRSGGFRTSTLRLCARSWRTAGRACGSRWRSCAGRS